MPSMNATVNLLESLLTPEMQIRRLNQSPILKSTVMDTYYVDRPLHPLPRISAEEILEVADELPVVERGGASTPIAGESGGGDVYVPRSIRPSYMITGADLRDLAMVDKAGAEQWVTNKTEYLRRRVRKTTEAMAAQSMFGSVTWVKKTEAGYSPYTINWGSVLSVSVADDGITLWDAVGVKSTDVFGTLDKMLAKLGEYGYGTDIEIWAASDVYTKLQNMSEVANSLIKAVNGSIDVNGFTVKRMNESYKNPQTKAIIKKLAAKTVIMFDKGAGQQLPYLPADDLKAEGKPLPFFIKTVVSEDPSGIQLIAEAKPFPMPVVKGICTATVLS